MAEKEKTFEESMARLEEIVSELEKNEKPLDETIQMFEEGLKLVRECDGKLKAFEKQINDIVNENEGEQNEN
jgi:exodeoxyribonuclease VII small subunit